MHHMGLKGLTVFAGLVAALFVAMWWAGVRGEWPVQKLSQAIAAATEEVSSGGQHRLVVRLPTGMFGWCGIDGGAIRLKDEFERRHPELRFGDYAVESCVITLNITARPRERQQ